MLPASKFIEIFYKIEDFCVFCEFVKRMLTLQQYYTTSVLFML